MPPVHRLSIYQRILAANLLAYGVHRDEVQDHFGVNQGTLYRAVPADMVAAVSDKRQQLGLPVNASTKPRSGQPPRKDSHKLVTAALQKMPAKSMTAVAKELGVSHSTLKRALDRFRRTSKTEKSDKDKKRHFRQALQEVRQQPAVPDVYKEEYAACKKPRIQRKQAAQTPLNKERNEAPLAPVATPQLITIPLQDASPYAKSKAGLNPKELWNSFIGLNKRLYESYRDDTHPYQYLEQLWQRFDLQQETPQRISDNPQRFIDRRAREVFSTHVPHTLREIHLAVDADTSTVVGEIWLTQRMGASSYGIVPAQLIDPQHGSESMKAAFEQVTQKLVKSRGPKPDVSGRSNSPSWRLPPKR